VDGKVFNGNFFHLYSASGFAVKNCAAKLIRVLDDDKPVYGLTTLNNELFVRYLGKDITVYDTETYTVQRTLQVPGLGAVSDMTACYRHQCIYIGDAKNNLVHRIENTNKVTEWPVNDRPHGLSVNSAYNVLVTCDEARKIKEFTTDGQLIREISLHSDLVRPAHTVELTTEQFVVCHGQGKDPLHRVCIVDSTGQVLRSYGGPKGSKLGKLNSPGRLAVHGNILVTDLNNERVLMLNETLSIGRQVVSGLSAPVRMWFDARVGRLYIADNKYENKTYKSGQIKIYSLFTNFK
jgi:DNA-binding beta-propeller fold protein YncE